MGERALCIIRSQNYLQNHTIYKTAKGPAGAHNLDDGDDVVSAILLYFHSRLFPHENSSAFDARVKRKSGKE